MLLATTWYTAIERIRYHTASAKLETLKWY